MEPDVRTTARGSACHSAVRDDDDDEEDEYDVVSQMVSIKSFGGRKLGPGLRIRRLWHLAMAMVMMRPG
jgi:hypothetical protein